MESKSIAIIIAGALVALIAAPVWPAEIDVGKVEKYHEIDATKLVVEPDAYPELTLDDLRKITMYSDLAIRGSRMQVADSKYMRSVDAHPRDRDLLVVVSDHFRFTVFKNGQLPAAGLKGHEKPRCRFLWIKHATKETSPDGKPWLKDLILLPLGGKKTVKVLGDWPFARRPGRRSKEIPLFFTQLDPRPDTGDFPPPEKCVVGTFESGRNRYLVVDAFAGFTWWGRVAGSEYVPLRGKPQDVIDAFHGGPPGKKQRRSPRPVARLWNNTLLRTPHYILVEDARKAAALIAELPKLFAVEVRSQPTKGWEDLLRLDAENRPVKAVDDQLKSLATFGDVIRWAGEYLEKRDRGDVFTSWFRPLDEQLEKGDDAGHIKAARVVRYAFRRLGFPATIRCVDFSKKAWFPQLRVQVYVPSMNIVWVMNKYEVVVFRGDSRELWGLPHIEVTRQGKLPVWDAYTGGGRYHVDTVRK